LPSLKSDGRRIHTSAIGKTSHQLESPRGRKYRR
jgi:hypothetical protein